MNIYKYHGYALCGGILDNGKPWKNIRLMLTRIPEGATLPRSVELAKMAYTDPGIEFVHGLPNGSKVDIACDTTGKVVDIKLAK